MFNNTDFMAALMLGFGVWKLNIINSDFKELMGLVEEGEA